jgi:hypothetical protein
MPHLETVTVPNPPLADYQQWKRPPGPTPRREPPPTPRPEYVYCDPSTLLEMETMSEFIMGEGIVKVVVNDNLYDTLIESSLKRFTEEIYNELKLWKKELPEPEQLYNGVREKLTPVRSKFVRMSTYAVESLGQATQLLYKAASTIEEHLSSGFKSAHAFSSSLLAEIVAVSRFMQIKILARGKRILALLKMAFKNKFVKVFVIEYVPKIAEGIPKKLKKKKKNAIFLIVGLVLITLGQDPIQSPSMVANQILIDLSRIVGIAIPPSWGSAGILVAVLCP